MTNADDNWQLEGGCIADGWVKPESNTDNVTEGTYVDRLSINEERVPQPPGRLISSTPIRRTDDVTEGLAQWVAAHVEFRVTPDDWRCQCGAIGTEPDGMIDHRAQALLPTVRELQAGAWDEGYEAGIADQHDWEQGDGFSHTPNYKPHTNPYREAGE